jgi:hypothetical protein
MKHFFIFSFLVLLFVSCSSKNSSKKATKQVNVEKIDNEFVIKFDKENNLSKQSIDCLYQLSYSKKTTDKVSSLNRFFKKGKFLWILIEFTEYDLYAEDRNLFIFEKIKGSHYQLIQSHKIQLPMGQCSISLEQLMVDLGELIIVNETGDGNGYCACFPSFYKVNGSKLHLQNTLELVTYSFPEGQDYFTESSFSFSKKGDQVIIESESWNQFPDQEKKFKKTKSTQTFEMKGDSLLLVK